MLDSSRLIKAEFMPTIELSGQRTVLEEVYKKIGTDIQLSFKAGWGPKRPPIRCCLNRVIIG